MGSNPEYLLEIFYFKKPADKFWISLDSSAVGIIQNLFVFKLQEKSNVLRLINLWCHEESQPQQPLQPLGDQSVLKKIE